MADQEFPHLTLLYKAQGAAKFQPSPQSNNRVEHNRQNRSEHASYLAEGFRAYDKLAKEQKAVREKEGLPEIAAGVPFLLQIPDEDDEMVAFLSRNLGLELVAEYDEGYVIVSTEELDLQKLIDLTNDFISSERGSGQMARILEIDPEPLSDKRLARILDEEIQSNWPLDDSQTYVLDISIEVAPYDIPREKPKGLRKNSTQETRERLVAEHAEKTRAFWDHWDEETFRRQQEIDRFVQHYGGDVMQITDNSHLVTFPDSFSVRIRMNGQGFTDLIKNYPNLFEVTVPDEIEQPFGAGIGIRPESDNFNLLPPPDSSPSVCVIDSGIQENHQWLQNAILSDLSRCFVPGEADDDVADYVSAGGHGTRVAGACFYPERIPLSGDFEALFWLINARVLDDKCGLSTSVFPPQLIHEIVRIYKELRGTRLFQHSIASNSPCRIQRMSTWAAAMDLLSFREDVLFLQAAGNLYVNGSHPFPGIIDHIRYDRDYPAYLTEPASRIANPAQSLQALTVGSISQSFFEEEDKRSVAPERHPSSFTRTGFGMWNSIKPEVVEFGGDYVRDSGNPPALSTPAEVCPELLRSTLHSGPAFDSDTVGTSFAAPKVAHIAGTLEAMFPDFGSLLYRALIVNSARWPDWAESGGQESRLHAARTIGYGLPSLERSTTNSEFRVTLTTDQIYEVRAGEGLIYGVPIPEVIRRPGEDFGVRIDVTLSYAAEPRRTRKSRRGYLAVWLDWKASRPQESFDTFSARMLKDLEADDDTGDGNFSWMLGNRLEKDGATNGVSRGYGTVQKDWTVARSYELPETFGVVVRGHKGWARNDESATARFALTVSFEINGTNVMLYEKIKEAVEAEIETNTTVNVTV